MNMIRLMPIIKWFDICVCSCVQRVVSKKEHSVCLNIGRYGQQKKDTILAIVSTLELNYDAIGI